MSHDALKKVHMCTHDMNMRHESVQMEKHSQKVRERESSWLNECVSYIGKASEKSSMAARTASGSPSGATSRTYLSTSCGDWYEYLG